MSLLTYATDDIKPEHVSRKRSEDYYLHGAHGDVKDAPGGPGTTHVFFYWARDPATVVAPTALVSRYDPGRSSGAHYHAVDQFQIIFEGKCKFGRRDVAPYHVHFARAYTQYGPLLPDMETGCALLALRTRYDPGSQHGPAALDKLKRMPDRLPLQIHHQVTFPALDQSISIQDIPQLKDDEGLVVYKLAMAPHTQIAAPDPSGGDGQFVVVLEGSLVHDHREHQGLTVVLIKPEDDAYRIQAGSQGLHGLILNMPQVKRRVYHAKMPATAAGFDKWQCALCAFSYDEAQGMPADGIPAGTRWEDVPASWTCPDCAATKSDFRMVVV